MLRKTKPPRYKAGDSHDSLTIINPLGRINPDQSMFYYAVRCICGWEGKMTTANFGKNKSCVKCGNVRSGAAKITHGATGKSGSIRAPLYKTWRSMLGRCKGSHEHNRWYAAKGIKVCPEWEKDFVAFRDWAISANWAPGLSIDRIETNKDYSPDNCRWITRSHNSKKLVAIHTDAPLIAAAREWALARRSVLAHGGMVSSEAYDRLAHAEAVLQTVALP